MADIDLMDRILATARLRLPGAIESAVRLELFNAIDEFLKETSAWRHTETVPLIAGMDQFPIFPPAGSALVRVMAAFHNGIPLLASGGSSTSIQLRGNILGTAPPPDFDTTFEPDITNSPGGIFAFSIYFPQYITIDVPASDDAARFPIKTDLALTLDVDNLQDDPGSWVLPEYMFSTYHDAFLAGLLSKMMQQSAKPYSNPPMAMYNERLFRKLKSRAKQEAIRGFVFNRPHWSFPRFGGQR